MLLLVQIPMLGLMHLVEKSEPRIWASDGGLAYFSTLMKSPLVAGLQSDYMLWAPLGRACRRKLAAPTGPRAKATARRVLLHILPFLVRCA